MAEIRRMSMNIIMSRSRIFCESSSEDSDVEDPEQEHSENNIKDEDITVKSETSILAKPPQEDVIVERETIKIKGEPKEYCEYSASESKISDILKRFKSEPDEDVALNKIKPELDKNVSRSRITPDPVTPIKKEQCVTDLNASPDINLKMLALQTPIKCDNSPTPQIKSNVKAMKRTMACRRSSPNSKSCHVTQPHLPAKYRKLNDDSNITLKQRKARESDPAILERRQKQIDFGKNTIGYDNYSQMMPRECRTSDNPVTPNKYKKYSRRAWDGLIKQWRIKLHSYDDYKESTVKEESKAP